jgi:hypothetical protein
MGVPSRQGMPIQFFFRCTFFSNPILYMTLLPTSLDCDLSYHRCFQKASLGVLENKMTCFKDAISDLSCWVNNCRACSTSRIHHEGQGSAPSVWPLGRVWLLIPPAWVHIRAVDNCFFLLISRLEDGSSRDH